MADDERDLENLRRAVQQLRDKYRGTKQMRASLLSELEITYQRLQRQSGVESLDQYSSSGFIDLGELDSAAGRTPAQATGGRCFSSIRDYLRAMLWPVGKLELPDNQAATNVRMLYMDRKLSVAEVRLMHWCNVLRRGGDGLLEAVGPQHRHYIVAKIGLGLVGLASACFIVWIVDDPFSLQRTFAPCAFVGGLLGWIARDCYDMAWGRRALAQKTRLLMPWVRLREAS